jgi:hypothetical protein
MLPEPRYAEWRQVAVRRIPAQWIGFGIGFLVAAVPLMTLQKGGYVWVLIGTYLTHQVTNFISKRRTEQLRDDPEGGDFAVSLSLRREVGYGHDEGLVTFAEGWLVYSGRQCSFSVRHEDVTGVIIDSKRYGFLFRGPAGRSSASLYVSEPGRFGKLFRSWAEASDVQGKPIYPPVVPTEEAMRGYGYLAVVGLVFSALLAMYSVRQSEPLGHWFFGSFALIFLLLSSCYGLVGREAVARIQAGLPYRRNQLSRFLSIKPVGHSEAAYRRSKIKASFPQRRGALHRATPLPKEEISPNETRINN